MESTFPVTLVDCNPDYPHPTLLTACQLTDTIHAVLQGVQQSIVLWNPYYLIIGYGVLTSS